MIPDFEDIGLLVIDVQERLIGAMPDEVAADVVRNIDVLAELVADLGGQVVRTEQYPRGLGPTVETLRNRLGKGPRLEKIAFSCLDDERFCEEILPGLPSHLIVVGMEAHVCVLMSVLALLEDAWEGEDGASDEDAEVSRMIYVPVDAICSRKKLHWENALDQMTAAGAVLTNTETLVFQSLREAGSDRFKHFSKRIR